MAVEGFLDTNVLVYAAAEALGARIVYSEDLGHGRQYGPVRVCDPFRSVR